MSTDPAPGDDPLGHVAVGDPAPLFAGPCKGKIHLASDRYLLCDRGSHPREWQHIASGFERVVAVWTDEPQPGSADS